jgi:uncharacterized membrane protein YbhN (UPF0104 family)
LSSNSHTPAIGAGRRRLSTLVGVAIGLAVLGLLIWVTHPVRIWDALQEVRLRYLGAAILLNIPVLWLRAERAQLMLRRLGWRVGMGRQLLIQLVGQSSSTLTPAGSGDAIRAFFWRRDQEVPLGSGITVVLMDRLYSFVLLAAAGLAFSAPFLWSEPVAGVATGAGVLLGVVFPWALAHVPEAVQLGLLSALARIPLVGQFARRLEEPLNELRYLAASPALMAQFAGLTLATFLVSALQVWLLLAGVGTTVAFWAGIGAYSLSQFGGILSTLPFGLGPGDILLAALLARAGVALTAGISATVLFRAASTLPFALGAVAAYLVLERKRAWLRSPDPQPAEVD